MEHRLPSDSEIHAAALWRLAEFPQDVIEDGTDSLAQLLEQGIPFDSSAPEVADLLAALKRPGDRRNPWTALMALAVMLADVRGDACLFYRTGAEIVTAWRNSTARTEGTPSRTELSDMMAEFQENMPHATAYECFDRWRKIAETQSHPVLVEYDSERDALAYEDRGEIRTVTRESFARQFRRVQLRMKKIFTESRTPALVVQRAA